MPRIQDYYDRKSRGVCVECEAYVTEFVRCSRCLEKRAYRKKLERESKTKAGKSNQKSVMQGYRERKRKTRYRRDSL